VPTSFIKGDLFEDSKGPDVYGLAFAAECSGDMSKGVAVAFKKRWPALAEALRERAAKKNIEPGEVVVWRTDDVVVLALCVLSGEKEPKLSALNRAVESMLAEATKAKLSRIAIARIGGFDPVRVKRILSDAGDSSALDIVVFEQFVRARSA
jgi:O-acetyl-ADP-ribose deacetylase (regulator of RNase III)